MRSHFNLKYEVLNSVKSTNDFLKEKARCQPVENREFVLANYQEGGKGQREKKWESENGKNVLFTMVFRQGVIDLLSFNRAISLCLRDFIEEILKDFELTTEIKWPNDILVDGKKIAGVLIENSYTGKTVQHSFVGIGLNVNQQNFPLFDRAACSLIHWKNKELGIEEVAKNLAKSLIENPYMTWSKEELQKAYNQRLYLNKKQGLFLVNNQKMQLQIQGSNEDGQLVLLGEKGRCFQFNNGELKFLE